MKRRVTRQLGAVYDVLAASQDHPTADQVFQRVRRLLPRVSLGTVYRNLDKLRDEGRLRVVRLEGGQAHYDAMTDVHDHFVCESCGAVVDFRSARRRSMCGRCTRRAYRCIGRRPRCTVCATARAGTDAANGLRPVRARGAGDSMDLPARVPLFPLPNAVLFPGVPLPLHIFEPRYRDMVRDAERGEARLIGMVLLRGEWRKEYYGCPEIYPVGCAGRMVSVEPLADGRYNILLHGVREFTVVDERQGRQLSRRRSALAAEPGRRAVRAAHAHSRAHAALPRGSRADADEPLAERSLAVGRAADQFSLLCARVLADGKTSAAGGATLAERGARLCDVVQFALETSARGGEGDKWYH